MRVEGGDMPAGGIGAVALGDVLRGMLRHRKKLILLSTLLFAALGYAVIALSSPVYTAASQVLVDYEETPYTRAGIGNDARTAPRQITDRDVRSQVEVIRSQDLALKVLRQLELVGTREFDPLKRGIGPLGRLKIALGFTPDPRRQTVEQRALTIWQKRLKVYNLPNTKVIVIEFDSTSPKTAARVANTLAEMYVEQTRARRLQRTSEARQWLKQQIEKLRAKVVAAEKAVESHRARAGLFQGVQARLHNQELSELSAQIVRAAAERSQAEAKAKAIRRLLRQGRVEQSADVLRSPLIQRLREQQVQIRRRLAELSTVYLDNHPRVKAVRKELADLKRQIDLEARKIAESLEEQARIAAAREAELRARQKKMKAQVSAASLDEVKLRELEREAKAQRSLLESFLARYTDAMTRDDKQALPGMASIIARAMPPAAPSFPKPGPIMLLAVLAGLVLGLGLAFILEVMAAVRQAEAGMVAGHASPQSSARFVATQKDMSGTGTAAAPAAMENAAIAAGGEARPGADARTIANTQPAADTRTVAAPSMPTAMTATTTAAVGAAAGMVSDMPQRPVDAADARVAAKIDAILKSAGAAAAGSNAPKNAGDVRHGAAGEGAGVGSPAVNAGNAGHAAAATGNAAGNPFHAAVACMAAWHEDENMQRFALTSLGLLPARDAETVMRIARALAGSRRVVLLDVAEPDFRLPAAKGAPGLADLLRDRASFADAVIVDGQASRLHLVRAGTQALPDGALAGEVMDQLLRALGENYDMVLLHEGLPRFPLHEKASALPLADGVVILHTDEERELAEGLRDTLQRATRARVAIVGPQATNAAGGAGLAVRTDGPRDDAEDVVSVMPDAPAIRS